MSEQFETLESQVDRLAKFIVENIPGEPSQSQGAIDTAIRIMKIQRAQLAARDGELLALREALEALTDPDGHIWHGGNSECTGECQEVRRVLAGSVRAGSAAKVLQAVAALVERHKNIYDYGQIDWETRELEAVIDAGYGYEEDSQSALAGPRAAQLGAAAGCSP